MWSMYVPELSDFSRVGQLSHVKAPGTDQHIHQSSPARQQEKGDTEHASTRDLLLGRESVQRALEEETYPACMVRVVRVVRAVRGVRAEGGEGGEGSEGGEGGEGSDSGEDSEGCEGSEGGEGGEGSEGCEGSEGGEGSDGGEGGEVVRA